MSDDVFNFDKAVASLPWPTKGDQLFITGDDWWNNACLSNFDDQMNTYADGYKRAADLLVAHVNDTKSSQDTLVYPVVFLYRHYLELRLKKNISDGNKLLDDPVKIPGDKDKEFPTHHNIAELWKLCRKILEQVWPEGPSEDLDALEESIVQFSEKDSSSLAFRYPIDKNGEPTLIETSHINLRNLAEVMDKVASLLDSASMGITEYLSLKRDMESGY